MRTFTGCSGYYYNHWKEIFYPIRLPKNKWLSFYAEHFKTVEVNSSFYNLLSERALKNWYDITPADFTFTLKGYRFLTHIKKLIIDADSRIVLNEFLSKANVLKEKTGPILWQLPPQLTFNPSRLNAFCKFLSKDFIHVVEFRHISWYQQETFDMLSEFGVNFCIVSAPGMPDTLHSSPSVAYVRFHGKTDWYNYNYSHQELVQWAEKIRSLQAEKVFAYFNNDFYGYAIQNSMEFGKLLSKSVVLI